MNHRGDLRSLSHAPADSYTLYLRARAWLFSRLMGSSFAAFGARSTITPPVNIAGAQHVHIGAGVVLGPGCSLMVGGIRSAEDIRIVLADGVSIAGNGTISAFESVVLGVDVLLARGVYISDHNHAYRGTDRAVKHQGVDTIAPVVIGNGAWLGQNVVITPGVHVGTGAVVAANAVVTRDVPSYSLAVGSPARIIRSWSDT
jgi:acetyltransferase-like isoleucine patch superfamily enzyme